MNIFLKTFVFTAVAFCFTLTHSNAQKRSVKIQEWTPIWDLSLNGGMTFASTDVNDSKPGSVFGIGAGFQPLSFLQINVDIQKGLFKEGDHTNNQEMFFKNSYLYGSLTARFYPLALILTEPNSSFKNTLYVGTGLALTKSNVDANDLNHLDIGYIDNYKGADIFIPIELGVYYPVWNSKINNQSLKVNLNLRHHFSFSDELDGYVPQVPNNKNNDVFSQITLGLSYNF